MHAKVYIGALALAFLVFQTGCAKTSVQSQQDVELQAVPEEENLSSELREVIQRMASGRIREAEAALSDQMRASDPVAAYLYAECAALRGDNGTAIDRFVDFAAANPNSALTVLALERLLMINRTNNAPLPSEKILALRSDNPYAAARLTVFQSDAVYNSGAIYRSPDKTHFRHPTATPLVRFHWMGPFSKYVYSAFGRPMVFDKDPVLAQAYTVDDQKRTQFRYQHDFVTRLMPPGEGIYVGETQIHVERDADIQFIANANQFYQWYVDGQKILERGPSDFGKNRLLSAAATLTRGDHVIRVKVGILNPSDAYTYFWMKPLSLADHGDRSDVLVEKDEISLTSLDSGAVSHIRQYNVDDVFGGRTDAAESDSTLKTWLVAMSAIAGGRVQKADEVLKAHIDKNPGDVVAKYWMAQRYREDADMLYKTRNEKAIQLLSDIGDLSPEFGHAHLLRMKLFYDQGQPQQALDVYKKYRSDIPDVSYTNGLLGDIAAKRGWPELANHYYIRAAEQAPYACNLNNLALEKMAKSHHYVAYDALNPTLQACYGIIQHFADREGNNVKDEKRWNDAMMALSETYPNNVWFLQKALGVKVLTDPAAAVAGMNELIAGVQAGFYKKPDTTEMLRFIDLLRASHHESEAGQILAQLLQIDPVNRSYLTLKWMMDDQRPFESLRIDGMKTIRDYLALNRTEEGASVFILDYDVTHYNPDGSRLDLVHNIYRVLNKQGKYNEGDIHLPPNAAVLKLRTIKGDTFEIIEPEKIDYKKSVSAPNLDAGDFLEIEYIVYQDASSPVDDSADFGPFWFGDFQKSVLHSEWIIEYPKSWKVDFVQSGLPTDLHKTCTEVGDYTQCRAYVDDVPVAINEPNAPQIYDILPNIQFYHRTGWNEKIHFIDNRGLKDARQSPYVEDFYRHIEMPQTDSIWERANAIYRAVQKEIQYDGKFSLDATNSITRGSGSRMNVLKALYDRAGIPNYYALVRHVTAPRNSDRLPTHSDDGYVFYLVADTEKGLAYIHTDITDIRPFDYLYPDNQNMEVIPMVPGMPRFVSRRDDVGDMLFRMKLDYRIQADGSAALKIWESGRSAFDLKKTLLKYKNDHPKLRFTFQHSLAAEYGRVTLNSLTYQNLDDNDEPIVLEMDLNIDSLASVSGSELVITHPFGFNFVEKYAPLSVSERKYPVAISGNRLNDRTLTFHAPSGYVWQSATLRDISLDSKFGRYRRSVQIDGETIILHENIELLPQYVELEDYAGFRDFCLAIDEAQRIELRAKKDE